MLSTSPDAKPVRGPSFSVTDAPLLAEHVVAVDPDGKMHWFVAVPVIGRVMSVSEALNPQPDEVHPCTMTAPSFTATAPTFLTTTVTHGPVTIPHEFVAVAVENVAISIDMLD